jgi:hypothetical protein
MERDSFHGLWCLEYQAMSPSTISLTSSSKETVGCHLSFFFALEASLCMRTLIGLSNLPYINMFSKSGLRQYMMHHFACLRVTERIRSMSTLGVRS